MDKKEAAARINDILAGQFEINRELIKPEADLINDLGIDSLDIVDFVVAIERNFGVKVDTDDLSAIRKVGDLYEFIARKK
jgi:acyl carrier protein